MSLTQPLGRIEYAKREVARYHDDVEDWKKEHDELRKKCWPWEDLVGKANWIFDQVLDVDLNIREAVFKGEIGFDAQLEERVYDVLRQWLEVSIVVTSHIDRLEKEYGSVEGGREFRRRISQAQAMLTPDSKFFGDENLARLRDKALEANARGLTERLLNNGCAE